MVNIDLKSDKFHVCANACGTRITELGGEKEKTIFYSISWRDDLLDKLGQLKVNKRLDKIVRKFLSRQRR